MTNFIYLDVCCLNRPFDNWTQERVKLEGEAILSIIDRVEAGEWQLVGSEVIALELEKMPNLDKKEKILNLLELVTLNQNIDAGIEERAYTLESLGFRLLDAFHLACAEAVQADIFLSTDDRLLNTARRCESELQIAINNPVIWLMTILQS